jgi:peptidyl-prolyl cis-trans isomerase SurA
MTSRIFLLPTFLFSLILPAITLANVVDRSVAIVNEDTITLSEVNELGKSFFQKITEETPANQLADVLQQARKTVIDKLIDKKLLLQQAKKLNIRVSDEDVENALKNLIANNKSTMEQFRKEVGAMGMSEKQYREDLREQILSSKLINYEIRSKVIISDEKIKDYFNNNQITEKMVGNGEYYILQIGCTWDAKGRDGTKPTQAGARAKAERVRNLALKGDDFKALAKQYSDLPSAADGGDLGVFQQHEMAAYIRDAVVNLKTGEISQIVETDKGYQFFKILPNQEGKTMSKAPYESVKEEIREKLYQQAMELRYKDWLKAIRDKAYIKIL